MTSSQLSALLDELLALPRETEWVEFKHNNADAQEIGEYLSALSNAAALHRQVSAYIVWGVDDKTHKLCGTTFRPRRSKGKGNEDLEPWLLRGLDPRVQFEFHTWEHQGHPVVMLRVASATGDPRTRCQRPDPPGLHGHRVRADGRDLPRSHGDHQPRRAPGGHAPVHRHAATFPE